MPPTRVEMPLLAGIPPAELESVKLQVEEHSNCWTIVGRLPGVRREDVDILLDDDRTLRLAALRRDVDAAGQERVVGISRNLILHKSANPNEDMRADLDPDTCELTIVIMKVNSQQPDLKRRRLS